MKQRIGLAIVAILVLGVSALGGCSVRSAGLAAQTQQVPACTVRIFPVFNKASNQIPDAPVVWDLQNGVWYEFQETWWKKKGEKKYREFCITLDPTQSDYALVTGSRLYTAPYVYYRTHTDTVRQSGTWTTPRGTQGGTYQGRGTITHTEPVSAVGTYRSYYVLLYKLRHNAGSWSWEKENLTYQAWTGGREDAKWPVEHTLKYLQKRLRAKNSKR